MYNTYIICKKEREIMSNVGEKKFKKNLKI